MTHSWTGCSQASLPRHFETDYLEFVIRSAQYRDPDILLTAEKKIICIKQKLTQRFTGNPIRLFTVETRASCFNFYYYFSFYSCIPSSSSSSSSSSFLSTTRMYIYNELVIMNLYESIYVYSIYLWVAKESKYPWDKKKKKLTL